MKNFKDIFGTDIPYQERMQLPAHKAISVLILPCTMLRSVFLFLRRLCRDRRMDEELKKLNDIDNDIRNDFPIIKHELEVNKEKTSNMVQDALERLETLEDCIINKEYDKALCESNDIKNILQNEI